MSSIVTSLATCRATSRQTSGTGNAQPAPFTFLSLSPYALWDARSEVLDAGGATPDNGENTATWQDQSGNGNHLSHPTAGWRPSHRTADGPNGTPCERFEQKILKRDALHATLTNPTIVMLVKLGTIGVTAGSGVADLIFATDGTPNLQLQDISATTMQLATAGAGSGVFTVPHGQWVLLVIEAVQGAGRVRVNANQARLTTALGACSMDSISLGSPITYVSQQCVMDLALFGIFPTMTETQERKLRTLVNETFDMGFPSESEFLDTFSGGDTVDSTLPLSDSGHAWELSGAGMANGRILGGGLTVVAPWSTVYWWLQHQFIVTTLVVDYDYLFYGGAGGQSVNAIGITRYRQNLTDMVHILPGFGGILMTRHYPAGGASVEIGDHRYATDIFSGRITIRVNRVTGIITITGADNIPVEFDWNTAIPSSPLSNYQSSGFVEIIAPTDPDQVMRYTRVQARR